MFLSTNETRRSDGAPCPIQPTPVIGMVGLIEDHRTTVTMGWPAADQEIWLLGVPLATVDERVSLAGSSYLATIHGQTTGRPPTGRTWRWRRPFRVCCDP